MPRPKTIRPGRYNTRLIIYKQDPTQGANADGEIPEKALEVGRRWAEVYPRRGQVRQITESNEADILYWVRLHRDKLTKTLTPKFWFVTQQSGQRLNISGALDVDNAHQTVELECTERLS